jgi:LPPG:FO 2-phospho-L-lactate transferase
MAETGHGERRQGAASDEGARARYLALSGGIGGAKLALGLAHLLGDRLTVVVNTGDDFTHLGLHVAPDVDTTLYTLAGLADPERGWGLAGETWQFMASLARLGGPTWFNLGDSDLAMHVERTRRLAGGETLSAFTADVARRLGIAAAVVPMSDEPVATLLETENGVLEFQHYFVREQCRPAVRAVRFTGSARARPAPGVLAALADPDLAGIVLCPSNPYLSVAPILSVPGLPEALRAAGVPIVAVSPVVGGQAIKGPTAKIMGELGLDVSVAAIRTHYAALLDALVVDRTDAGEVAQLAGTPGPRLSLAPTVMRSLDDRIALARHCTALCRELAAAPSNRSVSR